MNFLQKLDGNKTYVVAIFMAVVSTIHYIAVGDFSVAAFLQYVQSDAVAAGIAALRHGMAKTPPTGNGGNLTGGVQQGG